MNIEKLSGRTKNFAEACYDQNSLAELQAPHAPADADETDMKAWNITAEQWSEAIKAALMDRQQYDGNGDAVVLVDTYTDFDSFQEAVLDMGNSIATEFGFDDQDERDIEGIISALEEWFSYSANRAEYNDGSWSFVEGETYLNRFPVNF